ncbi:hypothetical protein PS664_03156 [Pseudomonas fluorescens]|nr:hypothetical protein PS664_03156 [Pseudomonas fluorescens]
MSSINGYPGYTPYTSGNHGGSSAGNPALDSEAERSKQIQVHGLKISNDATRDSNIKSAAEKRR